MKRLRTLPLLLCIAAAPSSQPATTPADPALAARMEQIDSRTGRIQSLIANFQQQKFTALLNKPLVSSGRVRIRGSQMRWDTLSPQHSVLLIDQREAKIYYPDQKTLEIYALDQRLGELAASPLPRLDVLKRKFSFQQIAVADMNVPVDRKNYLALRLLPTDPSLREHVQQVRVLLDVDAAYIVKAEVTDADGERTVISFADVQLNVNVGDVSLTVPLGTRVTHPLEGLEPAAKPQG